MIKYLTLVALMIPLSACVESARPASHAIDDGSSLLALDGAHAAQAEADIRALGYQATRTEGPTAYWYNPATGACARIVTAGGLYSSIGMVDPGNC